MSLLLFLLFVKHQRPVIRTGISTSLIIKYVTKTSKVSARVVNAHLIVLYTEALRKTNLRCTFRVQADTFSTVLCHAYGTLVRDWPVDMTNPKLMSLTTTPRHTRVAETTCANLGETKQAYSFLCSGGSAPSWR